MEGLVKVKVEFGVKVAVVVEEKPELARFFLFVEQCLVARDAGQTNKI